MICAWSWWKCKVGKNATEALEALIPPDKTIVIPPPPPKKLPTKIMVGLGVAVKPILVEELLTEILKTTRRL